MSKEELLYTQYDIDQWMNACDELQESLIDKDQQIEELKAKNLSLQEQSIRDNQNWIAETTELQQQLKDNTKQVRNEVCDEIRSRFLATCQIEKGCDTASFSLEVLNRILDQIQHK